MTDAPTAPIVARLQHEHNLAFHFVDGPLESAPLPAMKGVLDCGPCYRWLTWTEPPTAADLDSVAYALDAVDEAIDDHGPFDGVLAFSQGASLAACYIARRAAAEPAAPPPFGFAILFSCSGLPEQSGTSTAKLGLPSLHVCGEADHEWLERSKALIDKYCEPGSAVLLMHKDGHTIPKDRLTVDCICREVERLLRRAMLL